MSPSEYARRRGVSHEAVRKAIARKRISAIERDGRKWIDPELADIQWARNTRGVVRMPVAQDQSAPKAQAPEVAALYDITEARARREHHEANLAAMREAREAAGLLPRDGVVRAATEAGAIFRQAVERIASLGTELAAESDPVKIRVRLEAVLRDALNEAAERLESLSSVGGPDGRS